MSCCSLCFVTITCMQNPTKVIFSNDSRHLIGFAEPVEEQEDQSDEDVGEDGPVKGTQCLNCEEESQYREKGKLNPYCGITCATETGALCESKKTAKLSNNATVQEEDTTWMGSKYMVMTGISHVETFEETQSLRFVAGTISTQCM